MANKSKARKRPAAAASQERRFSTVRASRKDILVIGAERLGLTDLYHRVLEIPGWALPLLLAAVYLSANTIFALLYMLDPGGIDHARPGSFADAFFFSVQTLSTIGYGVLTPTSLYANILVTAEAFFGLVLVAVSTGLIFSKFSRPTSRVMFSRVAVVTEVNGTPTFMFRAANQRGNQILEAEVMLDLIRQETTLEGHTVRSFHALPVARARTPLFALTWTIRHTIDAASPLHGVTQEQMQAWDAEIIVVLSGVDDIFAQRIHARHSYLPEEIIWNQTFEDVLSTDEDGRRIVNYHRFHDVRDDLRQRPD